jgi:hypothetical protein
MCFVELVFRTMSVIGFFFQKIVAHTGLRIGFSDLSIALFFKKKSLAVSGCIIEVRNFLLPFT